MSDISDPGGAGRSDRKRARALVDAAYAAGRISAADRSLRMSQVDAASTRGDLAMVTRDLLGGDRAATPPPPAPPAPTAPPATAAPTPAAAVPMPTPVPPAAEGTGGRPWPPPGYDPQRPAGSGSSVVKWVVIGIVAVFLLPCLLGAGGFVVALFLGADELSSFEDLSVSDVQTYEGWSDFVDDLEAETGSTRVLRADVGFASVDVALREGGGSVVERTWQGTWLDEDLTTAPSPSDAEVDLRSLSPSVVERLADEAPAVLDVDPEVEVTLTITSDGIVASAEGRSAPYDLAGNPTP